MSDVVEIAMLDELDEIIKLATGIYPEEDLYEGSDTSEDQLAEEGRKICLACGAVCRVDDVRCKKCGARQIIPNKVPRLKKRREKKDDDSEDLQTDDMNKESSLNGVYLKALLKGIKDQPKNALRAAGGVGVLSVSGVGAQQIHKTMSSKNRQPQGVGNRYTGMVRTASERSRRRGINPVYRIRKAKKLRLINAFLGRDK